MLAHPVEVGEQVESAPAAAWWRGRIWLAVRATDATLVLRSVDVLGNAHPSPRFPTGFPCGGATALAVNDGSLHILLGTPGESYTHTSTHNGLTFAAPNELPIHDGFVGTSGFTAYPGGLAILWGENAGGQAHLLTSTDNGGIWNDALLPFSVMPEPSVCIDPTSGRLFVFYTERGSGGLSHIALVDPASATVIHEIAFPAPDLTTSTAICTTNYHNHPGLHVAAKVADPAGEGSFLARSAPATLAEVGGVEKSSMAAGGLSLVVDGTRAWVAWVDLPSGELWVGPYASAFEMPEDLMAKLDTPCDPAGCPPDPRLVCAATDDFEWLPVPAIIHNAERGDLILSPGDGAGIIGTMLGQLRPPQTFDHMGIMIRDQDLIRHATMAHDRIKRRKPGRFMTGEFFGDKAPVDGFRPDALTYGWPGTITQSIEDAFYTGFNTLDPTGQPYNRQGDFFVLNPGITRLPQPAGDAPQSERDAWTKQQQFADPEFPTDEPYRIHNFPNVPAYVMGTGQTIEGIVVKPAPGLEAGDPRIRQVLDWVAAAAETIDGHYRFYGYTDAAIAVDPASFGPAATDPRWAGKPPGAAWAAGTRPVVCSSFVWTAIQLANAAMPGKRIEVEGATTEDPKELMAQPPVDGLYRYLVDERVEAGKALHDMLAERVRKDVYLAVQEAKYDGRLAVIDALSDGKIGLDGLLTALEGPAELAANLLGIALDNIAALKLLFEDMPDDVATQMCNTFASDRAIETDDDLWRSPGEGVSVSPDDIVRFWDAPNLASIDRIWHGLYGHTQRMLLTPKRAEPKRKHRWDRSRGPAFVAGKVHYRGVEIEGARVRFGCETTKTKRLDHATGYTLAVNAGRYEVVAAAYWPDTQQQLTGRTVVEVVPGDQPNPIDIELEDPVEWRRLIRCTGKIDTVRKVVVGKDDWAHKQINAQEFLTWAPATWGPPPVGASVTTWTPAPAFFGDYAQRFSVRVDLTVTLREDLWIDVTARSRLCENYYKTDKPPTDDQVVQTEICPPFEVPPGGRHIVRFDHVSGNVPPDRGHVELTIENLQSPA